MGRYEELHEMETEAAANRVRSLNDSALAQLVDSVTVMVISGNYPREAFPEVQWVGRLLSDLKVGNHVEAN